ncbi:MAG: molybdopterin molybdotransferase MoeA [Alphaproteobacteria bacterium]|tara:strand:+ start:1134 stop:2360 length:1227 start_codon:yes stop_codon:yes gene_type:complete
MKKNQKLMCAKIAQKKMKESISFINKSEKISIEHCQNRIIAENIYSKYNIPFQDNSAVDGYAINFCQKKKIKTFILVGESKPGKPYNKKLKENEAISIYTGSYIIDKNKINTVLMLEDCKISKNKITIKKKFRVGQNIRKKGEDLKENQIVFRKGRQIRTVDIAQLLSIGQKKIKVYKQVTVGVLSTGSEINQTKKKQNHLIFDANKLTLISMLKKIGCNTVDLGTIKDDFQDTKKKILNNIPNCDLLISSGGVSDSDTDMIGKVLISHGKINFWKLAIKPGRPFAFGEIKKTPFIGLPGNPVATIVTFLMLVVDYIKVLSGNREFPDRSRYISSGFSMKKKLNRREWIRGSIINKGKKQLLEKYKTTGSGIISSISQSEGIIEVEENVDYIKKGMKLKFLTFEDILS